MPRVFLPFLVQHWFGSLIQAHFMIDEAILYDRHVQHRGVRSKLKTHAQPYHGGDGCKAEPFMKRGVILKCFIGVSRLPTERENPHTQIHNPLTLK